MSTIQHLENRIDRLRKAFKHALGWDPFADIPTGRPFASAPSIPVPTVPAGATATPVPLDEDDPRNPFNTTAEEQSNYCQCRVLSEELDRTRRQLKESLEENVNLRVKVKRTQTMAAGLIDLVVAYREKAERA